MNAKAVTYVVVPGIDGSGPDHWQTLFAAGRSDVRWVHQKEGVSPQRRSWVKRLSQVIGGADGDVVLVAHCHGVVAVAHWAAQARDTSQIVGALLVAPIDVEGGLGGIPPRWVMWITGWTPIPMQPLPFRATVVGSANDPMCSIARARALSTAWGASFLDLGCAGHVDAAAGYGSWRGLDRLLATIGA